MISWDEYFLKIAQAVAERANCKGRKVGAILVQDRRIIATGYNGTPSGMVNCLDGGCDRCSNSKSGKDYDKCLCIHAEENCLIECARLGIQTSPGAWMYTTMQPCFYCLKHLVQAGIEKVIYSEVWDSETAKSGDYYRLRVQVDVRSLDEQAFRTRIGDPS